MSGAGRMEVRGTTSTVSAAASRPSYTETTVAPSCLGTARRSGLGSEADGPRPIVELRGDAMTGTAPMTRFDEVIEHSITRVVMAVTTLN